MFKKGMLIFILVISAWTGGQGELGAESRDDSRRLSNAALDRSQLLSRKQSLIDLRRRAQQLAQTSAEGASYVSIIPYVTQENNTRTNVGLNNFARSSVAKGLNPTASVLIALLDPQGNLTGSGTFEVASNQLRQIDNIIPALGANIGTGWLLIFSDVPLTAWASVIFNSTNDPSIELAVADQISKPQAFVESQGTPSNPLMIQSSVKTDRFQSSLIVVNIGDGNGNLTIKIYDNNGNLIRTKNSAIQSEAMYIDHDVRNQDVGTFGQIVIEVSDPTPNDDTAPRIVANSIVKSADNTGAFFPAYALPQPSSRAVAGVWSGTMTGPQINAQVLIEMFQERDMIYGFFTITGGAFPTTDSTFVLSGQIINNRYLFDLQDAFDTDLTFISLRLFGETLTGSRMDGDFIYFDEKDRRDVGRFSISRTGPIYE
ncbi:MAG: hypothetical protein AB1898_24925 [Acidobacteriota bacterium]